MTNFCAEQRSLPKIAYSVIEAAAATSLSKSTIWAYISEGKLKTHRVGGRVLMRKKPPHSEKCGGR